MTEKIQRQRYRKLIYGDINLVPVETGKYPYLSHEGFKNSWHLPGQSIATTAELVKVGTTHGIRVWLVETTQDGQPKVSLT